MLKITNLRCFSSLVLIAQLLLVLPCLSCGHSFSEQPPLHSGKTGEVGTATPTNMNQRGGTPVANGDAYNLQAPVSPDALLTPGDTLDVIKQDICTRGYSKKVRNVPQSVKEEAYREYGINSRLPGEYEIDHLISLELGGSNSLKNLWPESFQTQPWNAHVKDALENKLHEMICSGQIDIKLAQREIATDWIAAYKKYVGAEPGAHAHSSSARQVEDNSEVMTAPVPVFAKNGNSHNSATLTRNSSGSASTAETSGAAIFGNKKSHIYHRQDCPDYVKVSPINRIEFKSVREAEAAGYRIAGNCPK